MNQIETYCEVCGEELDKNNSTYRCNDPRCIKAVVVKNGNYLRAGRNATQTKENEMTLTITVPNSLKPRTFDVERADDDLYILRGARGAVYGALRFVDDPNCLHIMKVRGACLSPFPGVILTDRDGTLCQVS